MKSEKRIAAWRLLIWVAYCDVVEFARADKWGMAADAAEKMGSSWADIAAACRGAA